MITPPECCENLSVVILDAFCARRPVIAAKLGVLASAPDFYAALGKPARRTVEANCSLDALLSRSLEIFQSAIGSLAPAPAPEEAVR